MLHISLLRILSRQSNLERAHYWTAKWKESCVALNTGFSLVGINEVEHSLNSPKGI